MPQTAWWQHGVIYQIYPRSFQDSNGDGVGDLEGIRRRLDYLTWLGVDAIWISPIYPSPMADFGYDVADYCDIAPLFGTLADFDQLIADVHARGMKLILDFVPNHTSDQHPWFLASRSSRDDPKRDWYIWRDAKPDGSPPNNWLSDFGGSAWQWDEATQQYYLHLFLKEQPDLNWRNPQVQDAMYDALRFWLKRGVDGFRVDVLWYLIKDDQFRDNPVNPGYAPGQRENNKLLPVHTSDQPEVHAIVAEMRKVLDEFGDRVLIGEIYLPIERLVTYYGQELQGAQLPFNFQLIQTAWHARAIAALVDEYEAALPPGGWPNWVLGNHDQTRIAGRVGKAQARVAAMLLLTLRGTPTMYYGDEIGLDKVEIPPDRVQDTWEKNEPGLGLNRDPERTPMQWDGSTAAGFTDGQPWLPLSDDHASANVTRLREQQDSILTLYQSLIELRRAHEALSIGTYVCLEQRDSVFLYERCRGADRVLVALNFSDQRETINLPQGRSARSILLSTHGDRSGAGLGRELELGPNEGLIVQFD